MKRLFYFPSFLFLYTIYLPFKFLPYRVCLSLGVFVTALLFPLARRHRKIADENLSFAFPEMTADEKKQLIKKHFRHLGILLAGSVYSPRMNDKWMGKYLIYDKESREIEEETKKEGVGVVLISGHLGTWEPMAQFMGVGMKGAAIYKKIRNPLIDTWLKNLREVHGIRMIPLEESGTVARLLKQGYWVAFGSDQNAGKAGIFVNFFNRPASTFQGPVLMAYLTGAKMLLYSILSGEEGKVIIRVKEIGFVDKKLFPTKEEVIHHYTERWSRMLEEEARLFPEQYFWVHRRWRTKPGDF